MSKLILVFITVVGVFGATEYGIIDSTVPEFNSESLYVEGSSEKWNTDTLCLWWVNQGIDSTFKRIKGGEARVSGSLVGDIPLEVIYQAISQHKTKLKCDFYYPDGKPETVFRKGYPQQEPVKLNWKNWLCELSFVRTVGVCMLLIIIAICVICVLGTAIWMAFESDIRPLFWFVSVVGIAVAAVVFGGCTPPAITVQHESRERIAFNFLAEEQFYNCEARTWVFPFGGPKDNLTLEVLQPGEGWRPVTDFGLSAWWKGGEVHVVDIKDRLGTAGCVMWRIMERQLEYATEVKK